MTWDAYNRRKSVLREVLTLADRRREDTADQLLDAVPGGRDAFADDVELLRDVQMVWFQRLSGRLDREVLLGVEPSLVAVEAWTAVAAEMPGARSLLDANADRPELVRAFARERELLALTAGVTVDGGARLVEQARDQAVLPAAEPERRDENRAAAFVARLRNALAA